MINFSWWLWFEDICKVSISLAGKGVGKSSSKTISKIVQMCKAVPSPELTAEISQPLPSGNGPPLAEQGASQRDVTVGPVMIAPLFIVLQ